MKRREFFASVSALFGSLVFGKLNKEETVFEPTMDTGCTSVAFDIETQSLMKRNKFEPTHPQITFNLPSMKYSDWPPYAFDYAASDVEHTIRWIGVLSDVKKDPT